MLAEIDEVGYYDFIFDIGVGFNMYPGCSNKDFSNFLHIVENLCDSCLKL